MVQTRVRAKRGAAVAPAAASMSAGSTTTSPARVLDAMPDTLDFRDRMYIPTLVEVAPASDLAAYRRLNVPVLDQGREGACTGFGLATVANYLLRVRRILPSADEVSARMLYVMAKRYDEWPGEAYEGSSARGAMKAWHKHGACARAIWRDDPPSLELDLEQAADALKRPLGAYFRVNHRDLVAMHAAISEVGVLYATSRVHEGWMAVRTGDTDVAYSPVSVGAHAFAIVGYDQKGFWIQNSWGEAWGDRGLVRVAYDDWLENSTDVWVARLGAAVELRRSAVANMTASAPRAYETYVYASLRPHVVMAENDGRLMEKGAYGLTAKGLESILQDQLPQRLADWRRKRVLIYAHGGLVPQDYALQYAANHREACLNAEVYPISVIWRSDAWSTIGNILQDAVGKRRSEGILDAAKDFMLDRLDDTLEPLARLLGGKALWDEMKENARLAAVKAQGAARQVAEHLVALHKAKTIDEVHLAGHSAGAVLLAPLSKYLSDQGVPVTSASLWAPACTLDLFDSAYRPLIEAGGIQAFDLYTLDDATERDDDCRQIYHKSLLYLVSAALEASPRIPFTPHKGTPLLGLARDVADHIPKAFWGPDRRWIVAPVAAASDARHHGDFDNDQETLQATLRRITSKSNPVGQASDPPAGKVARIRRGLDLALVRPGAFLDR
ncbi:MAG: C1 family peptidase [Phenylobacterium sp.]|uniref:C1 family peptidase n=1 Tax=Phenylobacterium sp. TaxID=1871053 RepID=UPI002733EE16|nr:C1 family peptidase [Phenylobacterium sp.]MDP3749696.1 C1 family peptidase [Phenylobacterium sp.]